LVPASDVEGLAAAIQELLENPQFCHQMREAARNKVLEDYDLSRNAQHLFNTMTRRLDALYPTSSR
jgi:glycosyltransferase involved in cell wall biosynthesis